MGADGSWMTEFPYTVFGSDILSTHQHLSFNGIFPGEPVLASPTFHLLPSLVPEQNLCG